MFFFYFKFVIILFYLFLGFKYLSTVSYSYWTIGYAITKQGAKKLLNMNPLKRLIALDEFLPIAYGKHPNKNWVKQFELKSNEFLNAFAVFPVIVVPEKYNNEFGYVSDTENSIIYNKIINETEKKINQNNFATNIIDLSIIKTEL